jgi:hypothetical protein
MSVEALALVDTALTQFQPDCRCVSSWATGQAPQVRASSRCVRLLPALHHASSRLISVLSLRAAFTLCSRMQQNLQTGMATKRICFRLQIRLY